MTNPHPTDPLAFWVGVDASDDELKQHIERQKVVDQVIAKELDPEAIPDLLLSQGENPDSWLDEAIEALEIALFVPPDPAELLVYPWSDQD